MRNGERRYYGEVEKRLMENDVRAYSNTRLSLSRFFMLSETVGENENDKDRNAEREREKKEWRKRRGEEEVRKCGW